MKTPGLRRRLALTLAAFTLGAAALLALTLLLVEEQVERTTLQELLVHELDILAGAPAPGPGERATLRYFRPARGVPAPAPLPDLPAGALSRALVDGREHEVYVREVAPGDRAYLAYDLRFMERRERTLWLTMAASVVLIVLAGAWLAGRIAAWRLASYESLLAQVRALRPGAGARLSAAGDEELAVIVSAINAHIDALDELIERERAFAAAASHELRTPLAVIRGAADALGTSPQVPVKPLQRIERAMQRATADLEALLAMWRMREPPPASKLLLADALPEMAAPHLPPGARVHWEIDPAACLHAAPGVLAIVFTNLLRNALAAAGEGGVEVRADAVAITVSDDGPGIPPEVRARSGRLRGAPPGAGLGLFIATTVAERQGWTVALEDRAPRGTRAVLRYG